MEFFVVVGVVATIWFALKVLSAPKQQPVGALAPPQRVIGACPRCPHQGQVLVVGGTIVCTNCAAISLRNQGRLPEDSSLPPGWVSGICRGCEEGRAVGRFRVDGPWLCVDCQEQLTAIRAERAALEVEAAAVMEEGNKLLAQLGYEDDEDEDEDEDDARTVARRRKT